MVNLVLVSHSKNLAESLVGLVRQMAGDQLQIGVAAGAGENYEDFGTDATRIAEVIQAVDHPDGILVLVDLGSAILSAEMALELLPDDLRERVHICPAPLVEGAITAGVQASLGSDIQVVCREARQALLPKVEHLAREEDRLITILPGFCEPKSEDKSTILTINLVLQNAHGLHARPAARFVKLASQFQAEIRVINLTTASKPVSGKSLNGLATLGALRGFEIQIQAQGEQAAEALAALKTLAEERFGEPVYEPVPEIPRATDVEKSIDLEGTLRGLPVSEGVAVAPIYHYESVTPAVSAELTTDPHAEWQKLNQSIQIVQRAILERQKQITSHIGPVEAAIFEAHALLLEDEDIIEATRKNIFNQKVNAGRAWKDSIDAVAARFEALEDPYLQQRSVDVRDVGNQVLRALKGETQSKITFEGPVILSAVNLTPTETAQLDFESVQGIGLMGGGATSHSSILARSLGIPAITGLPPAIKRIPPGTLVGLDGFNGTLWISPDQEKQKSLESARVQWMEQKRQFLDKTFQPATTLDGKTIEVASNVGNLNDSILAMQNGADGIGLLRTEFLFLTRETAPSEDEQFEAIYRIVSTMKGKPVVVRTLDVGGDKPLPYIQQEIESNPFLGVRAIRLSFQQPQLLATQLRAILRAGENSKIQIMFPMVASFEEVQRAVGFLDTIHQDLEAEHIPHAWPVEIGIMVEIPSVAIMADQLAPYVSFFSIGTNDLTQYTMAAERGNPHLAHLNDALHPSVLRLIQQVCQAGKKYNKWVGICGELASDPVAVPVLIGLGVNELSVSAANIPKVKAIVRAVHRPDAEQLGLQMLNCYTAIESRKMAGEFLESLSINRGN